MQAEPVFAPAVPVVPPPLPPTATPISFANRTAVRVALTAAAITCVLFSLPMPMILAAVRLLVLPVAGGFFASYLYSRRTGQELTVSGGARLGWLTGIFCFVFFTVLFTLMMVVLASPTGRELLMEGMSSPPGGREVIEQLEEMVRSPAGILGPLFMSFVLLTALPMVGGALGAKFLERD